MMSVLICDVVCVITSVVSVCETIFIDFIIERHIFQFYQESKLSRALNLLHMSFPVVKIHCPSPPAAQGGTVVGWKL